jgi:uncharacterized membrane protein
MHAWLAFLIEYMVDFIDLAALFAIAAGTLGMVYRCLLGVWRPSNSGRELRDGYLNYARWLIAALTLQLGADILTTATAPTWDDIGRLGAIAVIRTFLNYFLERDIVEAQRLKLEEARLPAEAKSTL